MTAAIAATVLASTALLGAHSTPAASPSSDELQGGKVPLTVLIDNDKVRVNLLTFPAGYRRVAPFPRRSDQLIVYLDDGQLAGLSDAKAPALQAQGSESAGQPVRCHPGGAVPGQPIPGQHRGGLGQADRAAGSCSQLGWQRVRRRVGGGADPTGRDGFRG